MTNVAETKQNDTKRPTATANHEALSGAVRTMRLAIAALEGDESEFLHNEIVGALCSVVETLCVANPIEEADGEQAPAQAATSPRTVEKRDLMDRAVAIDNAVSDLYAAIDFVQAQMTNPPTDAFEIIDGAIETLRYEAAQLRVVGWDGLGKASAAEGAVTT